MLFQIFANASAKAGIVLRSGALLIAALVLASCAESQTQQPQAAPPPTVTIAHPIEKTVTEWDEYTGRFEAVDTVEVRARISGVLNEVKFTDGESVKKGDLLFIIDPRPFQRILDRERANLAAAKVRVEYAAKDVERARPLLKNKTIPEQIFDQRLRAQREGEASVKSAEANVRSAELDVDFTRIHAPVSGRISRKLISEGNYVTGGSGSGTLLTTIVTTDPIQFYFDVSEAEYLKYVRMDAFGIRPASRSKSIPVALGLQDESGFPYRGRMDFLDNRIDENTGTLRGRAIFDNPQQIFQPGLFARIRIAGSGEYRATMLPDEAIATDQSNRFVFVVDDEGMVSQKTVVLGPLIDGFRVIRSGIELTDWVITKGIQRARPGIKVSPQESRIDPRVQAAALP